MSESQRHGFIIQKNVEQEVFHLPESYKPPYTAVHDISKEDNRFDRNENVSIKTSGSVTVCMGDPLRIMDYSPDEKHTALVIYYQQQGDRKVIYKTTEFSLDDKRALFGDVSRGEIYDLIHRIRSVPQGLSPAELKARRGEINALTKELSKRSTIRFNSKIDSKVQRRLQCSLKVIPPSIIIHTENAAVIRGIHITDHVVSGIRPRKNRV